MDNQAVLANTPFFSEILGRDTLTSLAATASRREFDQGEALMREGETGESLFVIVRGAVTVTIHESGMDRRVASLHDGDVVGEMSLLTGAKRTATVSALKPTIALEITKSDLQPILDSNIELALQFAEIVDRRKSELDELHGPTNWLVPGAPVSDLAERIVAFFKRS